MLAYWSEFFEDLQHVRGRSRNTILAYRRDLELFQEFKKTKRSLSAFYDYMKKQKLSPRSQARVISSLRTYFRFCESRGRSCPELTELRPPRIKVKLPKILAYQEFLQLYQACAVDDEAKTARNQMTLLLLYGLGCRVSELIGLNLSDYSETGGFLKILGKGNKERLVPVTENLSKALNDYLVNFREKLLREHKSASILLNDRGHRPSRVDVWRWLAAWSNKAGFEQPVHPHRFRHACATSLLEGGADLRSIQLLLGHASIQTTQIYTSVTTGNLIKTIEEFHPLSGLGQKKSKKLPEPEL